MSMDIGSERFCYVHCNFCNTILAVEKVRTHPNERDIWVIREFWADQVSSPYGYYPCEVSVPSTSLVTIVTVRCGHCANLLSVNMTALLQTGPLLDLQKQQLSSEESSKDSGGSSSSKSDKFPAFESAEIEQPRIPPIRPPEKRQRVPSAYNRFIKEEIQRIKASNPDISHREAFSTAAKNWAHFPHIHFGLKLDSNKKARLDQSFAGEGKQKSHGFY